MRVVVGAAAALPHRLLDGAQRGLCGRTFFAADSWGIQGGAVHACVDIANKLARSAGRPRS